MAEPLRIAHVDIGDEEKRAVLEVLASGQLAEGPRVKAFEDEFARLCGARHAIACSNGTAALHLALWAAGVGPGDEVIVPAFTFVASANAVLLAGARPILADVDPETFTLTAAEAQKHFTPSTRAVMPVHLYGHPADMDPLREIAAARGVPLIGDAAQAHAATYKGRTAGSLADYETFSFYPTKNVTCAEGGIVTTSDDEGAALLRSLRNHGRAVIEPGTYDHVRLGHNYRLTDVHAAIGLAQLARLPAWTKARRENARRLASLLDGVAGVRVPREEPGCESAWHQFTIVLDSSSARSRLMAHLKQAGIGCGVYYPRPLHGYAHLAPFAFGPLPVAERLAERVLSLPVHPGLAPAHLERIAREVERGITA